MELNLVNADITLDRLINLKKLIKLSIYGAFQTDIKINDIFFKNSTNLTSLRVLISCDEYIFYDLKRTSGKFKKMKYLMISIIKRSCNIDRYIDLCSKI